LPSIELLITGFLLILLVSSLISIRSKLPYTIALVFIGIVLVFLSNSYLLNFGIIGGTISQIRSFTTTLGTSQGGQLFVGLVVPPLIFGAMIHIRSSDLKSVIRPSFVLSTIGVVISTLVVGFILWKVGLGLSLAAAFLFAAIISPTDTATVLEIFGRLKVPSKLATLMETEAAFNDATGIVIFTIIGSSIAVSSLPLLNGALTFVLLVGGGVAVGLGVAFVAELIASMVSDRLTEIILTISVVYGSYVAATGLGFSGLIAVSVAGLYFGRYTVRTAIKPSNREAITIFWEIATFVGNSVAFLFIGLETDLVKLSQSLELIAAAYLAVIAARCATVYPILTFFDKLSSRFETSFPLKWKNVAMLGGVRGAISIALSATVVSSTLISASDASKISSMVLGVAFTSIILQGALLSSYIKRSFPEEKRAKQEEINLRLARTASGIETLQKLKSEGKISGEDFLLELERDRDELAEILSELQTTIGPTDILKTRASRLYDSLSSSLTAATRSRTNHEDSEEQQKSITDYGENPPMGKEEKKS
jgi:CPA1 family monovalent cation:H+ antiporter